MSASRKLAEVAPGIDQSRLGDGGRDQVTALLGAITGRRWKRAKRQQFIDRANKAGAPPTSILARLKTGRVGSAKSTAAKKPARRRRQPEFIDTNVFYVVNSLTIDLPLRVENESNKRGCWLGEHRRSVHQRRVIVPILDMYAYMLESGKLEIVMTRLAPRKLDYDGLTSSMKHVRDTIAWVASGKPMKQWHRRKSDPKRLVPAMGKDDDNPRFEWSYQQEKSPAYGLRIVITVKR